MVPIAVARVDVEASPWARRSGRVGAAVAATVVVVAAGPVQLCNPVSHRPVQHWCGCQHGAARA